DRRRPHGHRRRRPRRTRRPGRAARDPRRRRAPPTRRAPAETPHRVRRPAVRLSPLRGTPPANGTTDSDGGQTMRYTRLGDTGAQASRLGLGCMSFGDPAQGRAWTLEEDAAREVIRAALDAGVNFFDTANVYAGGSSEEILGRALADMARRDEIVIATKVFGVMRPGTNGAGLSRKAIMNEIDGSLRRLGTDHVDLYQIHRWDPLTPVEETMEALHDVVKAGKVRYIGASSMYAWQFAKAQHTADLGGWTRFVSMQDHYNLIYREEEREMHPLCLDQGVGVIPWSPLARGRLARLPEERTTTRSGSDPIADSMYTEA